MSILRLVESIFRRLTSRFVRPYRLVLTLPVIFIITLLAYLSGNKRYQHGMRMYVRIMLKLERVFYRLVIVPAVAFLPAPLAYGAACLRGDLRYGWDKPEREEVMKCLYGVLGDQLSPTERASITRDFFRLRSCEAVDVTRLAGKGQALARQVEIRGLEYIEAALAGGKGAILCTAHFGSFESSFSLLGARGLPITVLGRWVESNSNQSPIELFLSQLIYRGFLERHRHRPNIEPREGRFEVAVQTAKILRQNELIGTFIDPPALGADHARAIPMDFLNGKILLLPGATTIAQLIGAPVLMMFMRRSSDWQHQVLEISPPVPLNGDAVTAFRRCLAMVESAIRQNPAHWVFWEPKGLVELGLLPEEAMKAYA